MAKKTGEKLFLENSWVMNAKNMGFPELVDIPDIGLYMDQVIFLIHKYIGKLFICDDKESFITPAMINNYVKHNVIPAPQSKKYSKEHLIYLMIICLLKQSLSIANIKYIIDSEIASEDIASLYKKFTNYYSEYLRCILDGNNIVLDNADLKEKDYNLKLGIVASVCSLINANTLPKALDESTKKKVKK